ncbi:MAG: hypothetical protein JNJ58_06610 [Chitinophagaceae bacterium]|nr:hypothetical protein [Chitinophagaceae bacterium]
MKVMIALTGMLYLTCQTLFAQQPEKVYGFARTKKPVEWYKAQINAWNKVLDKDPKDADAWLNLFRATRNVIRLDTTDKREDKVKWAGLRELLNEMKLAVPDSYEYNLCEYAIEPNSPAKLNFLKRADELANGKTAHIDFMVNLGVTELDQQKTDYYCNQWFQSREVSEGLLNYSYNVLAGLDQHAIIFTSGDNDTYPAWILQSQGIRRDVTVLNLHLLHLDAYRAKVFQKLGITNWDMKDNQSGEQGSSHWDESRFQQELLKRAVANRNAYPVYIALTAGGCEEYIQSVEDKLYLTGMAYQYSEENMDDIALLKRNFENRYALDPIDKLIFSDISADQVIMINQNYIVPMLKLYDHYVESGDLQHVAWIKSKILALAEHSEQKADIKAHLSKQ